MNWRTIKTIAGKDIKEATQNKSVWLPILIVPLIFVVVMPVGIILGIGSSANTEVNPLNDPDFAGFMERMPQFIANLIDGLDSAQSGIVLLVGYLFAPFFLIMPLMFSTVIASESFAGERERKTIEALGYTPATDTELFMGKVLAALAPALLITWGGFLVYSVVVNVAAYPVMGRIWFPLSSWYPLILWISPALERGAGKKTVARWIDSLSRRLALGARTRFVSVGLAMSIYTPEDILRRFHFCLPADQKPFSFAYRSRCQLAEP